MIIEGILIVILSLAKALFSFINLPQIPIVLTRYIDQGMEYIYSGTNFVLWFFNITILKACFGIYLSIVTFKYLYKFIMWVIGIIGRIKSGVEL